VIELRISVKNKSVHCTPCTIYTRGYGSGTGRCLTGRVGYG